jgi:hypothetical protein
VAPQKGFDNLSGYISAFCWRSFSYIFKFVAERAPKGSWRRNLILVCKAHHGDRPLRMPPSLSSDRRDGSVQRLYDRLTICEEGRDPDWSAGIHGFRFFTLSTRLDSGLQLPLENGPLAEKPDAGVQALWRVLHREGIYLKRRHSRCVSTDKELARRPRRWAGRERPGVEPGRETGIQAIERVSGYVETDSGKAVRRLMST